jgi:hypothetical protein
MPNPNLGPSHQPQPAAALVGAKATTAIANAPKTQTRFLLIALYSDYQQRAASLASRAAHRIILVIAA